MPTRLVHIVVDSADPSRLAAFWAAALGWDLVADEPDVPEIMPPGFSYPGPAALPLVFVPVSDPKLTKNRIHLDLATTSAEHQAAEVDRLLGLGATRADIGQGTVPWEVLADPEGNEFCVLDARPKYRDTGPVAAIVVDCADPEAAAGFWREAAGWQPVGSDDDTISLRSASGEGPFLEFLGTPDAKTGKNRVHLDVAPCADGDTIAAAARLQQAGARPADVGQGEVTWVVLADPWGNEFCVLSPR
jgi:catechol 2,3-dioxygenase-like lactoylglutathione lyase family enzyme